MAFSIPITKWEDVSDEIAFFGKDGRYLLTYAPTEAPADGNWIGDAHKVLPQLGQNGTRLLHVFKTTAANLFGMEREGDYIAGNLRRLCDEMIETDLMANSLWQAVSPEPVIAVLFNAPFGSSVSALHKNFINSLAETRRRMKMAPDPKNKWDYAASILANRTFEIMDLLTPVSDHATGAGIFLSYHFKSAGDMELTECAADGEIHAALILQGGLHYLIDWDHDLKKAEFRAGADTLTVRPPTDKVYMSVTRPATDTVILNVKTKPGSGRPALTK